MMKTFPDYLAAIARLNRFGGDVPVEWLFFPGMLFSSRDKWWGDFKFRASAHEGIDITYFRTWGKEIRCFDDTVLIPAMDDGRIINLCDDFLGKTIVVDQADPVSSKTRVIYTYAHIQPLRHLDIGCRIKKNDIIARVGSTHKNPQLPPHLHFSCFEVAEGISHEDLNWNLFSNSEAISRIQPVFL